MPANRSEDGAGARERLVFAYFRRNGEDGLYLASSGDGLKWTPLNGDRPLVAPRVGSECLMRDPHITRASDGTFHMVWTTGWNEPTIGYACSDDLAHWSEQRAIAVMANEPGTRNCWAPELFYDEAAGRFLVFWSSTVEGRFDETAGRCEDGYNHRIYCTTTRDFEQFAPAAVFYDPGFPVIDATMAREGERFLLFVKDETRYPKPAKHVFLATSDSALGPYGAPSRPITRPWAEGPSAVKIGGAWHLYFDCYRDRSYGVVVSTDLAHWTDRSVELRVPAGAHHGCVLAVPSGIIEKL
jgi:sucrose-6-phosphate hydrolase SacC (GH32 family)